MIVGWTMTFSPSGASSEEGSRNPKRRRLLSLSSTALALAGAWSFCLPALGAQGDTPLGKLTIGGFLRTCHAFRFERDTPSQDPSADLEVESVLKRPGSRRFLVRIRGGYDGRINDARGRTPLVTLDDAYQDKDWYVTVDELFLDLYLADFDLRLGKQKISWGRMDEFQFTDNFNPEDWSEFVLRPEMERKIGVPAAVGDYYFGEWTIEGVWVPFFVPYRLAGEKDRWFFPLFRIPQEIAAPEGIVLVSASYPDVDMPARTLANSEAGLKLGRRIWGLDVAIDYFHGYDKLPTFAATGEATIAPAPGGPQPVGFLADVAIRPRLKKIDVFGFDFSGAAGPVAVRGEAAYVRGRLFNRLVERSLAGRTAGVDLSEVVRIVSESGQPIVLPLDFSDVLVEKDAVQYGLAADYTVSETLSRSLIGTTDLARTFVLLQLLQTVIRDHEPGLIEDEVETLLGATLRRDFWDGHLLFEAKGGVSVGGGFFARPRVSYQPVAALTVTGELRSIGGPRNRAIGQFGDHDELKLEVRYDF